MRPLLLILLIGLAPVRPARAGEIRIQHLLAGVRAFRAAQFEAALAEFTLVQQRGGAPDLPVYLGPTLYKLNRCDEARLVLAALRRSGRSDAVSDYYLAMSYYRIGLLQLAREVFAHLDVQDAGPKLAAGATRFIAEIDHAAAKGAEVDRWLATAEALERDDAARALDAAEEAFLRAERGSARDSELQRCSSALPARPATEWCARR
jgi:hypothetical protein